MNRRFFVLVVTLFLVCYGIGMAAGADDTKAASKKAVKMMKSADKAFKAQDYDKAFELFQKIIEMEPAYAPPYLGRALVFQARQEYTEALDNIKKAIQLQPDYIQARKALADTLWLAAKAASGKGQLKQANEYYLEILAIGGLDDAQKKIQTEALYQLAINYYSLKEHEKSRDYFLKFVEIPAAAAEYGNQFLASYYMLGLNLNRLARLEESNTYLLKFLELSETNTSQSQLLPLANFLVGSNLFDLLEKRVREAKGVDMEGIHALARESKDTETYLLKALELKPDLEYAYMKLGNFYYYSGDLDKAIATYETLIEKFPNSPDLASYQRFLEKLKESRKK